MDFIKQSGGVDENGIKGDDKGMADHSHISGDMKKQQQNIGGSTVGDGFDDLLDFDIINTNKKINTPYHQPVTDLDMDFLSSADGGKSVTLPGLQDFMNAERGGYFEPKNPVLQSIPIVQPTLVPSQQQQQQQQPIQTLPAPTSDSPPPFDSHMDTSWTHETHGFDDDIIDKLSKGVKENVTEFMNDSFTLQKDTKHFDAPDDLLVHGVEDFEKKVNNIISGVADVKEQSNIGFDFLQKNKFDDVAAKMKQPEKSSSTLPTAPSPIVVPEPIKSIPEAAKTVELIHSGIEEIKEKPIEKSTPTVPKPVAVSPSIVTAPPPLPVKAKPPSQQIEPMLAEQLFHSIGLDAWFKPERLHPMVESLIYWRDLKKSGIAFGAGLIILLSLSWYSVLTVFAYLSICILTGTISVRCYKMITAAVHKTNDGHPFKEYLEMNIALPEDKVKHFTTVASSHINALLCELRHVFLVEDFMDTIRFVVLMWVLTYLGAWFNGMTLIILAFVSMFTIPKVYEDNKSLVDTQINKARVKCQEITEKVTTAIPMLKRDSEKKEN